ncbi:formyltransferase family protein [Pseudoalteromonas sp. YIC-656]|uniref:formyltransferase family protein n=1 Tax=Pseudoalteromonas pernae TaxID=3118054 RepID=UPI003241F5C0
MKILFLAKKGDEASLSAASELREQGFDVADYYGQWGEPLPEAAKQWTGDIIISYLSRWVVPQYLLDQAQVAAINFHPAPPEYPGIGCNNFALYNGESSYGVTCHHMEATVDTGAIIAVSEFPLSPSDNVESTLRRTYDAQRSLFSEVINTFVQQGEFPVSDRVWSRKPYTREEFNALFEITSDMTQQEVEKRIRAVSFGDYQPFIKLHGHTFKLAK